MDSDREVQLVKTFVVPAKRERHARFVSSPKTRPKFLKSLHHFDDFDPACIVELVGATDSSEGVFRELKRFGAGDDCYLISTDPELDGTSRLLAETIDSVFANAPGTIICVLPGRLAYFEGEARKDRFILHRHAV